ncbi:MAG: hypothetical protein AB8F95_00830 [Bacteroidia bacterium]
MAAVGHTHSRWQELRTLLLAEEHASHEALAAALTQLEAKIADPEVQQDMLKPHFQAHIAHLQKEFPELFGESLQAALKHEISESRDGMIEALYPIIGQLISRYIKAEMAALAKRIEDAQRSVFSWKAWKMRFSSWFTGASYADIVMKDELKATLLEMLLVDNERGILLGSYSVSELLEPDVVAGMFTGIKEFVEHAFQGGAQALNVLEYERFKIVIHTFPGVYFAAVIDGTLHPEFRERLEAAFLDFAQKEKLHTPTELSAATREYWNERLTLYFDGFNQVDQ